MTKTDSLVNVFTPFESIINNLFITKTVEHPFGENYIIPDNIVFDFQVNLGSTYAGSKVNTTNGEKIADTNGVITITIKPGVAIGIQGIEEGTKVSVTEVLKDGSGFSVKDGMVTKEATISADGDGVIDFVNFYTPAKVVATNLNVTGTKVLEGREWKEGDEFTFELSQDDGGGGWKSIGQKTVAYDDSNKNFNKFDFSDVIHTLEFSQAGTYSFRISEVSGNISGIIYDKNVNEFHVLVGDKDMDGKLEIQSVTVTGNTTVTKDEALDIYNIVANFENKFTNPEQPEQPEEPEQLEEPKTGFKAGMIFIGFILILIGIRIWSRNKRLLK